MKLRRWDYDKQKFVLDDYPDGPIAEFVDFFRTTKAWEGDPQRVTRRLQQLEKALAEHRLAVAAAARANATAPQPTGGTNVQVA